MTRHYSGSVPETPGQAAPVLQALGRLGARSAGAEDDLLAGLASLGEPHAQRVLDDWLDLAADALRAIAVESGTAAHLIGAAVPAGRRADRQADPATGSLDDLPADRPRDGRWAR
jgi:hypothetical protein